MAKIIFYKIPILFIISITDINCRPLYYHWRELKNIEIIYGSSLKTQVQVDMSYDWQNNSIVWVWWLKCSFWSKKKYLKCVKDRNFVEWRIRKRVFY